MKKSILYILLLVFTTASIVVAQESKKPRRYSIGFHFQSTASKSASNFYDLVSVVTEVAEQQVGYSFTLKKYASDEEVMEALLANEVDAGMIFPSHIAEIKERGGDVMPWLTYVVNKQRRASYCVWTRKDSDIKNLKDIIGKEYLTSTLDPYSLATFRDYLADNGIDKPLWKVFSKFMQTSNLNSSFMALASGDADVIWGNKDNETLLQLLVPGVIEKIKNDFCTDALFARGMLVINRKTVPPADIQKAKELGEYFTKNIATLSQEHQEVMAMYQYTKLVKLLLIPAIEKEVDYDIETYKRLKKKGYYDEAKYIIANLEKAPLGTAVEIKADFKMCKELCGTDKDPMACVEKCLE